MSLKTLTEKKQREREETTLQFRGGCAPLQLPLRPFITQISATVGQRQREPRYHTVRSEHVRGNIVQAIWQRLCVCCRRSWGPGRSLVLDTINTLAHTHRDCSGQTSSAKRKTREVREKSANRFIWDVVTGDSGVWSDEGVTYSKNYWCWMQFTVDLSIDLVVIVTDVGSECLDDGRLVVLLKYF